MIDIQDISYKYRNNLEALRNISLQIKEGEIVSIIGKNGSGKSTLAKLIAGIIKPNSGKILVDDIDTQNKRDFLQLRRLCGIVFQNPENQIIFNNVHDDIIFTLNNLGLDNKEERIKKALKEVGMEEYINEEAYELSLGQKQRITIAGTLSVNAKYIVMDEPTAMLDSEGKEAILNIVKNLKREGYTIIYITNIIDEIFIANRVVVLEKGSIIREFETRDILENANFLKEKSIKLPKTVEMFQKLQEKNIEVKLEDLM